MLKAEHLPDNAEILRKVETGIDALQNQVNKISFLEKEVRELSQRLEATSILLKQPMKQENFSAAACTKLVG
ncbi:hypothetical protein [Segetibacter sp.]|jgi:hypothetical protein|uniref:hypothetical protein n=1 Tax=Segetibacter sp. TaxID=2231182 RepID=UPI00262F7A8F|nr:hypothetical protein [Segetibacter sp.]MCW3079689.1 hypothetical protein [Segetibacter sp.]